MYIDTTGAKSPWYNDIVEQHNLVLSEITEENHCSLNMTLVWCVNIKGSLQNVPGQNPSLRYAATDKLSVLSSMQTDEIIRQHHNIIHIAREAFIMSENSEKTRRAVIMQCSNKQQQYT